VLFVLGLFVLGPVVGAFLGNSKCKGATGAIFGGIVGGLVSNWTYMLGVYLKFYLMPDPDVRDLLGPVYTFLLLGFWGFISGIGGGLVFIVSNGVRRIWIERTRRRSTLDELLQ